jgi:hypothetical protein
MLKVDASLIILILLSIVTTERDVHAIPSGVCELRAVLGDRAIRNGDHNTNDIDIKFTDGWYPNQNSSSQPIPELYFQDCVTYFGVPNDALIGKIKFDYVFEGVRLKADYGVKLHFNPVSKTHDEIVRSESKGPSATLELEGDTDKVSGQLVKDIEMSLRASVLNPEYDPTYCQSPGDLSSCIPASRLYKFSVFIEWGNIPENPANLDVTSGIQWFPCGDGTPNYCSIYVKEFTWDAVFNADYYKFSGIIDGQAVNLTTTQTSYSTLSSSHHQLYSFTVVACNEFGCSDELTTPIAKSNIHLPPPPPPPWTCGTETEYLCP